MIMGRSRILSCCRSNRLEPVLRPEEKAQECLIAFVRSDNSSRDPFWGLGENKRAAHVRCPFVVLLVSVNQLFLSYLKFFFHMT